jgi:hypothetical protein
MHVVCIPYHMKQCRKGLDGSNIVVRAEKESRADFNYIIRINMQCLYYNCPLARTRLSVCDSCEEKKITRNFI